MPGDDRPKPTRTPPGGVPRQPPLAEAPPPGRTPTPDRLDREISELRTRHNELADALWATRNLPDKIDRLVHVTDKLDDRLDKYSERVVRAEALADDAQDAAKSLAPKLDTVLQRLGATERLADGLERLVDRYDSHGRRISALETEQQLAQQRADALSGRVGEVAAVATDARSRVGALETARTVDGETAKVRKLVARSTRSWWFSAKGVSTVVAAIAAAVVAVVAATQGGCL